MIKRLIPIAIILLIIVACSPTPESSEEETIQQVDSVAQSASATPEPIQPTEDIATPIVPVVQEPTIAPTTIPATAIPTVEPTSIPVTNTYNAPDWTSIQLVNARTGAAFTLADFAGQTVFVEPMATWCSNCRAQQGNVAQAMNALDASQFVFISLSVGENVSPESLATYADRNGFPQIFAVAPDNLASALVDQFGFTVVSPPATPHFAISPSGTVTNLWTGYHNPDTLIQQALDIQNS